MNLLHRGRGAAGSTSVGLKGEIGASVCTNGESLGWKCDQGILSELRGTLDGLQRLEHPPVSLSGETVFAEVGVLIKSGFDFCAFGVVLKDFH